MSRQFYQAPLDYVCKAKGGFHPGRGPVVTPRCVRPKLGWIPEEDRLESQLRSKNEGIPDPEVPTHAESDKWGASIDGCKRALGSA